RLTNMELRLIQEEYAGVVGLIGELEGILSSDRKLTNLIKRELGEVKKALAVPRRTQLIRAEADIRVDAEDLAVVEDVSVAILDGLRLRRCPSRQFNPAQIAEEKPLVILETRTDRRIRLFTNLGAALSIPVAELPETRPTAKPANLAALLPFEKNERIVAAFDDSDEGDYLFYTRLGNVKRTAKSDYRLRVKRTQAIVLKPGDALVNMESDRGESILLISAKGMSIRFQGGTVPSMGRVSGGVKCMKLDADDALLFAAQVGEEGEILCVSDKGFGKRSPLFDYELQGRNGKGMKSFDFKKNGSNGTRLAAALCVTAPHEFTLVQRHGARTRLSTESVRIEPRFGRGAMLVAVVLDDDVTGIET
ncbi:MAG: DNA gyrase C-terminal beta-propeller domain-containing protein, partial [Clostridia bacterium]|nr:DNA gyrase C-terminal beta-propeller domain-containing protein [Clostridia bacterium]